MDQLETRLEQELLGEWIADLNLRALGLALLRKIRGSKGGTVYPVATGARADGNDRISDALRDGADQLVLVQQANTHCVDERITLVRFIERNLAADGWYADAIAVVADAFHDSGEEVPNAG